MRRVCVFLEGQTELIFVREFLCKWYEYSDVKITCLQLRGNAFQSVEYDFGDENCANQFQLISVGNDNKVLSTLINRAGRLVETGYDLVVGLRDMYGEKYREKAEGKVKEYLNEEFISIAYEELKNSIPEPILNQVSVCFAIMEIETWILSMYPAIKRYYPMLSEMDLYDVGIPIEESMETIFHPAFNLSSLMQKCGKSYDKHKGEVNALMSVFDKSDYEVLIASKKSPTFNTFIGKLVGVEFI